MWGIFSVQIANLPFGDTPHRLQDLAPGEGSNHFIVVAPRLLGPTAFLLYRYGCPGLAIKLIN